jgi:hypothetical protein
MLCSLLVAPGVDIVIHAGRTQGARCHGNGRIGSAGRNAGQKSLRECCAGRADCCDGRADRPGESAVGDHNDCNSDGRRGTAGTDAKPANVGDLAGSCRQGRDHGAGRAGGAVGDKNRILPWEGLRKGATTGEREENSEYDPVHQLDTQRRRAIECIDLLAHSVMRRPGVRREPFGFELALVDSGFPGCQGF